jgi:large subunit ribosomal protein L35
VSGLEAGARGARLHAAAARNRFIGEKKMPKMKTHKATAKRFKRTASGRIRRIKIGKSHLRRRKSSRVLRSFDKMIEVDNPGSVKRVKRLLPYLAKKS